MEPVTEGGESGEILMRGLNSGRVTVAGHLARCHNKRDDGGRWFLRRSGCVRPGKMSVFTFSADACDITLSRVPTARTCDARDNGINGFRAQTSSSGTNSAFVAVGGGGGSDGMGWTEKQKSGTTVTKTR